MWAAASTQHTCLGLEIFCRGSSAISFHWATQPTVLATAKSTVYLRVTLQHISHSTYVFRDIPEQIFAGFPAVNTTTLSKSRVIAMNSPYKQQHTGSPAHLHCGDVL